MNNIEISEKMGNNIVKLVQCYTKACKTETKKNRDYKTKIDKLQFKVYDDYKNGKISKTEAIRMVNRLDNTYFNDIKTQKFVSCKFNNCKELLIEQLELFLLRLKKLDTYNDLYNTKQEDYDIDDYINIKKLNIKDTLGNYFK